MLEAVGDSALDEVSFNGAEHPDILKTTWEELHGHELIEPLPTGHYIFTGRGWTAALITTGTRQDPAFTPNPGNLFAEVKPPVTPTTDPTTAALPARTY